MQRIYAVGWKNLKGNVKSIFIELPCRPDIIGVAWAKTKTSQSLFMPETENIKERKSNGIARWKRWLNYQSLVRQIPFFLFLSVLAIIYIYNGHYADKTIRNITRTAKEVKELQWEYKTIKSEVMFRSKQSELVKAVEPLGLKEMTEAPVVLENK